MKMTMNYNNDNNNHDVSNNNHDNNNNNNNNNNDNNNNYYYYYCCYYYYIHNNNRYKNSNMYVHTYIRTYIHAYKHTYIHTYMHTYIHTYIRTYIHTYIHTYIPEYIYTYIAIDPVADTHSQTCLHWKIAFTLFSWYKPSFLHDWKCRTRSLIFFLYIIQFYRAMSYFRIFVDVHTISLDCQIYWKTEKSRKICSNWWIFSFFVFVFLFLLGEYGVECRMEPLGYSLARWVGGGWDAIERADKVI